MVYLPKVVYHWEVCPTWRWLYPQKYAILKNPLIFRESLLYFGKNRVIPLLWGPRNTPPSQTAWRCPCVGFLTAPPHCRRRHTKPCPWLPPSGFFLWLPRPKDPYWTRLPWPAPFYPITLGPEEIALDAAQVPFFLFQSHVSCPRLPNNRKAGGTRNLQVYEVSVSWNSSLLPNLPGGGSCLN